MLALDEFNFKLTFYAFVVMLACEVVVGGGCGGCGGCYDDHAEGGSGP